jgi:hypothetical protein
MQQLDSKAEQIRKHELPEAHLRGGWRHEKKVRDRLDRIEAESARLHAILNPVKTWEEVDSLVALGLTCDYCHEYVFADRRARWNAAGVCPRCTGDVVSGNDPNWKPSDTTNDGIKPVRPSREGGSRCRHFCSSWRPRTARLPSLPSQP